MGNNHFKDLIDFGTFSLVRLFRNLTPPSGGCWPMFALGLYRIRRNGCGCSGQIVNTTVRVYFTHVILLVCIFHMYILPGMTFQTLLIWFNPC